MALLNASLTAQQKAKERVQEQIKSIWSKASDAGKSTGAANITQLRAVGFDEKSIADYVLPLRARMIAGGAPKELVDEYFGGDPYLSLK